MTLTGEQSHDSLSGDHSGVLLRESNGSDRESPARSDVGALRLPVVLRFARSECFGAVPEDVNSERNRERGAVGGKGEPEDAIARTQISRERIGNGRSYVATTASSESNKQDNTKVFHNPNVA